MRCSGDFSNGPVLCKVSEINSPSSQRSCVRRYAPVELMSRTGSWWGMDPFQWYAARSGEFRRSARRGEGDFSERPTAKLMKTPGIIGNSATGEVGTYAGGRTSFQVL